MVWQHGIGMSGYGMGFPFHGIMVLVWCSYTTPGMGTLKVPYIKELMYLIGTQKWVTEVPVQHISLLINDNLLVSDIKSEEI